MSLKRNFNDWRGYSDRYIVRLFVKEILNRDLFDVGMIKKYKLPKFGLLSLRTYRKLEL